jgi:phosphopantothenoylcysteine decarboxylase / phosphopantothenate---cysteine ligase
MKVLLGVTGCIAAYKSAELLRLLQKQGYEVLVVMTENAQKFITPLTLATLSQNRVVTHMYAEEDTRFESKSAIEHIQAAHSADALLVAPATANTLAKFANGIADDFLSTLYLATTSPVIIAPAMNVNMWHHPAVQENVRKLQSQGITIIEPEEGYLAEGIVGKGRLASLDSIVDLVRRLTHDNKDFVNEIVLVTAGPTHEDIDPIRYITNRSSGKMGYQLAYASQMRGARTILVSGPTHLDPPGNVEFIPVRSALEMREKVLHYFAQSTIVVKAAAVADFKAREIASQKIKKNGTVRCLELVPTPDILSSLGKQKQNRILVGFAAETENVLDNARKKLKRKNLDLLVVNDVTQQGAGFDFDTNVVTILTRDGKELHLGKKLKLAIAHEILDQIIALKRQHV